ncbi:Protein of unknown function [Paenibacillus macquariensis]|uniref:DUF1499 domain-containing protein n=1 Tax=Paenibacillus macquariensis TaxID=948756 RepID=A0ABY1JYC7_9BACL|nr:Protein of unknown function [Paenibacillus macquariensis]
MANLFCSGEFNVKLLCIDGYFKGGKVLSLKRVLVGIIRSQEGTGDRAKDPAMKTRYYNLSKDKAWEEISSTLKKIPGYKVLHEVPGVGEIILEKRTSMGRTVDITVSVLSTGPVRSAVDIYSASRGSLGDLGANYRYIIHLFAALDKKLAKYKTSE